MWVVKLGGSLSDDALLPQWLQLLSHDGAGRVVVVCGGGVFADTVRQAQAARPFDDLAAHNMAVLAMAQTTYMLQAREPAFELAEDDGAVRRVLAAGRSAMWLPWHWLRHEPDAAANWDNTSDSIALDLSMRLGARGLVLVKSCAIDAQAGIDQQVAAGVLDRRFAQLARQPGPPVTLLSRDQSARMKALLDADAGGRAPRASPGT